MPMHENWQTQIRDTLIDQHTLVKQMINNLKQPIDGFIQAQCSVQDSYDIDWNHKFEELYNQLSLNNSNTLEKWRIIIPTTKANEQWTQFEPVIVTTSANTMRHLQMEELENRLLSMWILCSVPELRAKQEAITFQHANQIRHQEAHDVLEYYLKLLWMWEEKLIELSQPKQL